MSIPGPGQLPLQPSANKVTGGGCQKSTKKIKEASKQIEDASAIHQEVSVDNISIDPEIIKKQFDEKFLGFEELFISQIKARKEEIPSLVNAYVNLGNRFGTMDIIDLINKGIEAEVAEQFDEHFTGFEIASLVDQLDVDLPVIVGWVNPYADLKERFGSYEIAELINKGIEARVARRFDERFKVYEISSFADKLNREIENIPDLVNPFADLKERFRYYGMAELINKGIEAKVARRFDERFTVDEIENFVDKLNREIETIPDLVNPFFEIKDRMGSVFFISTIIESLNNGIEVSSIQKFDERFNVRQIQYFVQNLGKSIEEIPDLVNPFWKLANDGLDPSDHDQIVSLLKQGLDTSMINKFDTRLEVNDIACFVNEFKDLDPLEISQLTNPYADYTKNTSVYCVIELINKGIKPDVIDKLAYSYLPFEVVNFVNSLDLEDEEVVQRIQKLNPKDYEYTGAEVISMVQSGIDPDKLLKYNLARFGSASIFLHYAGVSPEQANAALVNYPKLLNNHSLAKTIMRRIPEIYFNRASEQGLDLNIKENLSKVFHSYVSDSLTDMEKQILKDEFGIEELNILSIKTYKEIIKNLDPKYNRDKPVLLISYPREEEHGVFENCMYIFDKLSEDFKLFVCSSSGKQNLLAFCNKFANLHGKNWLGGYKKKMQVFLLGHGNQRSLTISNVNNDDEAGDKVIDFLDFSFFKELDKYVYEMLGLISCSTGIEEYNLARTIFAYLDSVFTIVAPSGNTTWVDVEIQSGRKEKKIAVPIYSVPSLTLKR